MQTILIDRPDVYLDEMQLEMQEKCGVLVSESTLWRTLKNAGYTIKKVFIGFFDSCPIE
jgi:transposase